MKLKQKANVNELPVHGKAFVVLRCLTKGKRAPRPLGSGFSTKFSTFLLSLGYIDGPWTTVIKALGLYNRIQYK